METKIIYSKRVAMAIQEKGIMPLRIMKNPNHEQFVCWEFEQTEELNNILTRFTKEVPYVKGTRTRDKSRSS